MEELHLPSNVKVHYAGAENINQFDICLSLGVSYGLYTAFPFVSKRVFNKGFTKFNLDIPRYLANNTMHLIQDSGLFTLMFGAQKGTKDEHLMNRWYDGLVEFTLAHNTGCTCVEVDCQKVLGVDKAWEFRQRMKRDLPNNRIINVFHLEDGMKGLDKLIEFSEYIAISVPELRFANKKKYVHSIAAYIKRKKPTIDIHLLGCTELELLKRCKFCTSADSTSHLSSVRYGYIKGRHIDDISTDKLIDRIGSDTYSHIRTKLKKNVDGLALQIEWCKYNYQQSAGEQDYYTLKKIIG